MSDRAPYVEITPVEPLCFKCIGPRGDSLVMPDEDRTHLWHDDGTVNDDDAYLYQQDGRDNVSA